jgi:NADPH:quinone reductase
MAARRLRHGRAPDPDGARHPARRALLAALLPLSHARHRHHASRRTRRAELRDVADPSPAPGEILVRVHATAVNRADLLQRAGRYPPPAGVPQDIPGLEYAGVVAPLGDGVTRWRAPATASWAWWAAAATQTPRDARGRSHPIPERLTFEQAAAVPEAFITAHDALFTQMRLEAGETLLIHAVGSGVGTAALQLAKGRAPASSARSAARGSWSARRRSDSTSPSTRASRTSSPRAGRETDGRGVDGVLDLVGGDYLSAADVQAMAVKGRILLVGLVAGAKHELDMRRCSAGARRSPARCCGRGRSTRRSQRPRVRARRPAAAGSRHRRARHR